MNPIVVKTGKNSYEVWIGSGLLEQVGTLIAGKLKGPRCAIVSDENVGARLGDTVIRSLTKRGFEPVLINVPPGEKSKSLRHAEAISEQMSEARLDRSSFLIALGGGVVGDLGGFVAAIYHRGIPYIHVPTTLLAQVDSSIGGKTAVNIAKGKNLVGAWHQPALVISDTDTLSTLPPREYKQGFAEIVKHGVIGDAEVFEMLQRFEWKNLTALIRRNVELKAKIVERDERELSGERALLNFGHTVGHAIERASGSFSHGEAVSLGIVAACEISIQKADLPLRDRDRILATLQAFELPISLPMDFPREKILDEVRFDKKFRHQEIHFVVTPAIGLARIANDVTMDDIKAAIGGL